jgi:hypothetical protein
LTPERGGGSDGVFDLREMDKIWNAMLKNESSRPSATAPMMLVVVPMPSKEK